MLKSFGIIVDTLNSIDLITNLNQLMDETYTYCPLVFYKNISKPPIQPKFCSLQQQYAWGFPGPLISTDISTTHILSNCIRPSKKLFYVSNLEWTTLSNINFADINQVYLNPDIELIAKNKEEYDILFKVWKKPIDTIETWNYKQLISLIDRIYK